MSQGGQKYPTPLKSLKMKLMKLTKNEVIRMKFFNKSKYLSWSSKTSPWRHYDVIIIWFSIFVGQRLKTLYHWNNASYRICWYIVGNNLPSSKSRLIIWIDISVSNRVISVLNSKKIHEKSKKSEVSVGFQKFPILRLTYF